MIDVPAEKLAELGVTAMPGSFEAVVYATKDDGPFKKGQAALRKRVSLYFVPQPYSYQGKQLFKAYDAEPDNTFWSEEIPS